MMLTKFKLAKYIALVAIAICGVVSFKQAALTAEKIQFNYGLLGFEVKVQDLADFAQEGEISDSLNFYLKRISPQKTQKLQKFLGQSYDVDPILVYRYSRTTVGIKMLQRIGEIIQLPGYLNGFYGLRAAVVQAAQSGDGINLVDFLHRFPTDIKLNLDQLLKLVKQVAATEEDTKEFLASLSPEEVAEPKSDLEDLPNLSDEGQYQVTQQTLELNDANRDRQLITDLYLPQGNLNHTPVIVISNGLGAKRDRFEELAHHLASHGFAVVAPDHPGSDRQRQKDFLRGLYKENFDATDFIDRPLDISYILDRLEKLNVTRFNSQLDLEQVGIFGYSIGGTTALSLAGAEFDFAQLEQDCAQPLNLLNISMLYQCRALELPREQRSLKDERIKGAFMFVPFGKSMFKQQQLANITIPIVFQVVDQDFLTSLLEEQIPLFNALRKKSYLVICENVSHSNVTLSKEQQSEQAQTSAVAKTYQNTLSLVFFKGYIDHDQMYQPYLSSEYMQTVEQPPYKLHLIKQEAHKYISKHDNSSKK
ncbi:MAG: alpha/beta fold hydrolase [Cyanobacteria bacterium P01_E01_bin.35]